MSLILDHVNGVADDNRLENLRIVCPNCAATLDTHCGRNRSSLGERACELCANSFMPQYGSQRFCSRYCALHRKRGPSETRLRKATRPDYETLLSEVRALGYSGTGRRRGVSDNAIRKWVRAYETQHAAAPQ
ncbi:MAG: hypothetical protein M3Z33_04370 [Actinomycetota bacterium]|nr:hypothetical protein [Actinomycetota bacterium]